MTTADADPFDALTRRYIPDRGDASTVVVRCSPFLRALADRAAERWRGVGVAFRRLADGSSAAACLGVTGVGATDSDALLDLERRLGAHTPRRPW